MPLDAYRKRRNFKLTAEPRGKSTPTSTAPAASAQRIFTVQKHAASHLHYDLRLEVDGVLRSWAVPKGPSLNPSDRVLAVEVEDHPLEYADFEGTIPAGQYGGGTVLLWDHGSWAPIGDDDPPQSLAAGKLAFTLKGVKLKGQWTLVRLRVRKADSKHHWLLMKAPDADARVKGDIRKERPLSVKTNRDLPEIAAGPPVPARSTKRASKPAARAHASSAPKRNVAAVAGVCANAPQTPMPARVTPQLATLSNHVPTGDGWFHEIKLDGYRLLAFFQSGKVTLRTRTGGDWTARFPEMAAALEQLASTNGILDGESVALNERGVSDFGALQRALAEGTTERIVYIAFDVLHWAGRDVRQCPLSERYQLLAGILGATPASERPRLRLSEHIEGAASTIGKDACRHQLEGIVSKRADSPYESKRNRNWLKTKCEHRQEFVVVGYTASNTTQKGLAALLLAYQDHQGKLKYAGKVGSGLDEADLRAISQKLHRQRTVHPPHGLDVPRETADAHWVKPTLVAEISFSEWTTTGRVRQPVFHGLRADKPAAQVTREVAAASARKPKRRKAAARGAEVQINHVVISHPDRVVFPEAGVTKADIAAYYAAVAGVMLPHVRNRPISVLRCPAGRAGTCFFHKHLDVQHLAGLESVLITESKGKASYPVIETAAGLVSLAQMNCLEIHAWGALASDPDRCDRLVFDLDPGPRVGWPQIVETARAVRDILHQVKLLSFVKTSGGKGLHVVVPLSTPVSWGEAKAFTKALAQVVAEQSPTQRTIALAKSQRSGRVFIDYLRNGRGATSVAAYSTRAREGATISMPVEWEHLDDVQPAMFTIQNARELLNRRRKDPWKQLPSLHQQLPSARGTVLIPS